jgi:hypothetical protein
LDDKLSEKFTTINDSGEEVRNYITYNDETFLIDNGKELENAKGVISIKHPDCNDIIGINFKVS